MKEESKMRKNGRQWEKRNFLSNASKRQEKKTSQRIMQHAGDFPGLRLMFWFRFLWLT